MRQRSALVIATALAAALQFGAREAAAETQVFELEVSNGHLPAERRVVRVRQDDEVTLRWTSDKALTVHLHGYDIELRLSPTAPAAMRFKARASGRFPIEVHANGRSDHHRVLAHVEVHPR